MLLGDWEVGGIINARSGLPIEVGIVRPDVVDSVPNPAAPDAPNRRRSFSLGFWRTVDASAGFRLPAGFIAVVNTPGGGASRNVRRPNRLRPAILPG